LCGVVGAKPITPSLHLNELLYSRGFQRCHESLHSDKDIKTAFWLSQRCACKVELALFFWCMADFTPTVPLSTKVYKWVLTKLMLGVNPATDLHPIQREEKYC